MRKILGALRRADEHFSLIKKGDNIAIGLSGGKDSMVMLRALSLYKRYIKKDYSLTAILVDLGFPDFHTQGLREFAEENNVPLQIIKTQIGEIIFDIRREKNPCSLCAKMRKGAFYARAKELECNKAAFAHHMEDAIDTFFMSMLYESRLHTLSPETYLSRQDITLIRPLLYASEKDIISVQKKYAIPVCKNPCPANGHTKREEAKELVNHLCTLAPDAKNSIFTAIRGTLLKPQEAFSLPKLQK